MPFENGHKKYGGKKKGTPNKDTANIREYIDMLLEGRLEGMADRLDKLEGKAYFDVILGLMEYSIPKLNRTELTGNLETNITGFNYIKPDESNSKAK